MIRAHFGLFAGLPRQIPHIEYEVVIGRDPREIVMPKEQVAHILMCFNNGPQDGYDGEIWEVPVSRLR